jgi:hypothetical protein
MQSILDQVNFSGRGKEGKFVVFQYQEGGVWGRRAIGVAGTPPKE